MNKITFLLIVLCVFSSCNTNTQKKGIEIISKDDAFVLSKRMKIQKIGILVPPNPEFCFSYIYYLDRNNYLHKITLNDAQKIFELHSKKYYKSFSDFIYLLMNQRLMKDDSIFIRSMDSCCYMDKFVLKIYQKNKIKGLMNRYCKYDKYRKCYIISKFVSDCELETISYLFFINRYNKIVSDKIFFIGFYPFPDDFEKIK